MDTHLKKTSHSSSLPVHWVGNSVMLLIGTRGGTGCEHHTVVRLKTLTYLTKLLPNPDRSRGRPWLLVFALLKVPTLQHANCSLLKEHWLVWSYSDHGKQFRLLFLKWIRVIPDFRWRNPAALSCLIFCFLNSHMKWDQICVLTLKSAAWFSFIHKKCSLGNFQQQATDYKKMRSLQTSRSWKQPPQNFMTQRQLTQDKRPVSLNFLVLKCVFCTLPYFMNKN